jgi:transposase
MKRFVEGEDRKQGVLLPEYLDDYVTENNSVRVIDVFVDELDLGSLGFDGVVPEATGRRPGYHPGALLKIYVYGYLNQIQSSRRLEREAQRNVEMMWLTGRRRPTSRRSPTSGATTDQRSARAAGNSSCCAVSWIFSLMRLSPSTAADSRR